MYWTYETTGHLSDSPVNDYKIKSHKKNQQKFEKDDFHTGISFCHSTQKQQYNVQIWFGKKLQQERDESLEWRWNSAQFNRQESWGKILWRKEVYGSSLQVMTGTLTHKLFICHGSFPKAGF